jgi:DNA-binding transcriptional ArsR family regulator
MGNGNNDSQLDLTLFALCDANRRAMLERLGAGPASASELARLVDLSLPSAMKHLSVLGRGHLVVSAKIGRVRLYRICLAALWAVDSCLSTYISDRPAHAFEDKGLQGDRLIQTHLGRWKD